MTPLNTYEWNTTDNIVNSIHTRRMALGEPSDEDVLRREIGAVVHYVLKEIERAYEVAQREQEETFCRILAGNFEDCSSQLLERASVMLGQASIARAREEVATPVKDAPQDHGTCPVGI